MLFTNVRSILRSIKNALTVGEEEQGLKDLEKSPSAFEARRWSDVEGSDKIGEPSLCCRIVSR